MCETKKTWGIYHQNPTVGSGHFGNCSLLKVFQALDDSLVPTILRSIVTWRIRTSWEAWKKALGEPWTKESRSFSSCIVRYVWYIYIYIPFDLWFHGAWIWHENLSSQTQVCVYIYIYAVWCMYIFIYIVYIYIYVYI